MSDVDFMEALVKESLPDVWLPLYWSEESICKFLHELIHMYLSLVFKTPR